LKPVLLDTGVIVALLDRSERHHADCVDALDGVRGPLVTCEPVIAEACYLTRSIPGAPEAILQNVADGTFQIPIQLSHCAAAIQRILKKYRDQAIDLADACLIHLASELQTGDILTLDNDFKVYRWGTKRTFNPVSPLHLRGIG
jgi:predicted nucleic acid-binding protein